MDFTLVPQLDPKLIYREKDKMLFDTEAGRMVELNKTGKEIIDFCMKKYSIGQMVTELKTRYPNEGEAKIIEHVSNFFNKAKGEGLVSF